MAKYVSKITLNNEELDIRDRRADNVVGDKWIFIGDSYSQGQTSTLGVTEYLTSWVDYVVSYLGISDGKWHNGGMGGTGFCTTEVGGNPYVTFIDLLRNTSGIFNNDEVGHIIVCGGFNDRPYPQANIENAIRVFCSLAKELYPNAKIQLGMIGGSADYGYRVNLYSNVLNAYKSVARYGGNYMANTEYILRDLTMSSWDNIHPNQKGYLALGKGIAQAINGCLTVNYDVREITVKQNGAGILGVSGLPNASINNNILCVLGGSVLISTVPFEFNQDTGMMIAKLNKDYLGGMPFPLAECIHCIGIFGIQDTQDSNAVRYENIPTIIYFYEDGSPYGELQMWLQGEQTVGYGWKNLENVVTIRLLIPTTIFDTLLS